MPRTATDQLARSSHEDLVEARRCCDRLLAAARDLALASGHDPDIALCAEAGCRLPALGDDGRRCAAAHRSASLAVSPPATTSPSVTYRRFSEALAAAMPAIRTCRQTVHPVGTCWFSPIPDADGCGPLLQLAHELG